MREIKFRGYDTHTKIMLPVVDIIKFTKSKDIYITRNGAYGVGINIQYQPSIKIMQYTGLHDKNGKEIYEGDIVKKYHYEYDKNLGEIEKYNIEEIKFDVDICCFNVSIFDNLEVIGNIYENSDLLKD